MGEVPLTQSQVVINKNGFWNAYHNAVGFLKSFYSDDYDFRKFDRDWENNTAYFTNIGNKATGDVVQKWSVFHLSSMLHPQALKFIESRKQEATIGAARLDTAQTDVVKKEARSEFDRLNGESLKEKFDAYCFAADIKAIFHVNILPRNVAGKLAPLVSKVLEEDPVIHRILVGEFTKAQRTLADANGTAELLKPQLVKELAKKVLSTARRNALCLNEIPIFVEYRH